MLSLVIDGNHLFHKCLHSYHNENDILLSTPSDTAVFIRKVATDLSYIVKEMNSPYKIIFTVDSSSWRKNVEIEENDGYKSDRQKTRSTSVNWNNFEDAIREFTRHLDSLGFIVSKINGAEGDDLVFLWSNYLYKKKDDVIIVSGDGDLSQLVKYNKENFIVMYKNLSVKNRSFNVPIGFNEWLIQNSKIEIDDFFNVDFDSPTKTLMQNLAKEFKFDELDIDDFLFKKVMYGDKSDSVPSVHQWIKNEKTYRISETKSQKIKELILKEKNRFYYEELEEYSDIIVKEVRRISKDNSLTSDYIESQIKRNKKLMELSTRQIPDFILKDFESHFLSKVSIMNEKTQKISSLGTLSSATLVKGTPFEKGKTIAIYNNTTDDSFSHINDGNSSVDDDIDLLTDKLF